MNRKWQKKICGRCSPSAAASCISKVNLNLTQLALLGEFTKVALARSRCPSSGRRHVLFVRAHKDEHPSEFFDRQLRANPIVEIYDIEVLVRVLLEVSRSDSELRTEERAFLEEIVSDEATIERLSKAPHITVAEP